MGERFRRYANRVREQDPDTYFAYLEKARQLVGLFATRRRYAKELVGIGMALNRGNRIREALSILDRAVARARQVDHRMLAIARSYQALCRWRIDDNEGAVDAATEAVRLLEPLAAEKPGRYGRYLLVARCALAMGHFDHGRMPEAVPALVRYVRMARVAPDTPPIALPRALEALTDALHDVGLRTSVECYADAIEMLRTSGAEDDPRVADVLGWSVEPLGEAGLPDEAVAAGTEAITRYRKHAETDEGYTVMMAQVLRDLGGLGAPAERLARLEEALRILRTRESTNRVGFAAYLADLLVRVAACRAETGATVERPPRRRSRCTASWPGRSRTCSRQGSTEHWRPCGG